MIKTIHRFFYAWLFLTKLPALPLPKATKEDWGRITPYFVIIGFILGFILYFFAKIFIFFKLPILFSAILILLIWNLITGALHLDGLMDTFDGISCQDKSKKLEAMKDSRIGAFGAIAGFFVLALKLVCLCTVLSNKLFFVILICLALSRLLAVYSLSFLSKNKESGVSSLLITSGIKKPQDFLINLAIFVMGLFFVLLVAARSSQLAAIFFVMFSYAICLIWAHWLDNHFKGHSGDTYGALIELSEVTILSFGVILKNCFL